MLEECRIYYEKNSEAMQLLAKYNIITSAEFVVVNSLLAKDATSALR